ncbi:hypothetical protein GLAREA_09483 [Glarea lozoyensis ATCC 20868]|uniref:Family c-likeg-protein-coupled receptor protein n=1 Tax=Glarea lozoyensis (strain ATCC 20868 / MF5171) TaxID=1116229 RepID=S3DPJ1_GLAL2|nr:uncharacterized protein GLAREA_09483 [Glarea lozoyensis ATCC 20868]EPE28363.1 hypothetical protein GLAREA_09483 [Glarea lozoyensis ATCC 20868]
MIANQLQVPNKSSGPPYPPNSALLGGLPVKSIDDPITAVFLALFVLCAVGHMSTFVINKKHGRLFPLSALCFGFCMARIVTCTMRIVWTSYSSNVRIAIAAQIFVQAGVIILYLVNLIFTQRIFRASYPHWAWKKWFALSFNIYFATIVLTLAALIAVSIQSFYTLDTKIRRVDRVVQLYGATYFAVAAFLPLPILLLKLVIPARGPAEKFGRGRFRTKIGIVAFASTILTLGAAFRAGTSYVPRPRNNPAWYHSKTCFYLFNFTIEIIVVALYLAVRIDKRFIVPDGSHGPGHYANGVPEKSNDNGLPQHQTVTRMNFGTEENVFYDTRSTMGGPNSESSLLREHPDSRYSAPSSKSQLEPSRSRLQFNDTDSVQPGSEPSKFSKRTVPNISVNPNTRNNVASATTSETSDGFAEDSAYTDNSIPNLFPIAHPGNRRSHVSAVTSAGGESIYDDARSQFSEAMDDENTRQESSKA